MTWHVWLTSNLTTLNIFYSLMTPTSKTNCQNPSSHLEYTEKHRNIHTYIGTYLHIHENSWVNMKRWSVFWAKLLVYKSCIFPKKLFLICYLSTVLCLPHKSRPVNVPIKVTRAVFLTAKAIMTLWIDVSASYCLGFKAIPFIHLEGLLQS